MARRVEQRAVGRSARLGLVVLAVLAGAALVAPVRRLPAEQAGGGTAGDETFERDIAPILVRHCLECHNGSEAEGNLDLTRRAGVFQGGDSGPAVVPGEIDDSYLFERISAGEMPPEGKGRPLSDEQVETIGRWIRGGAAWPDERVLDQYELTSDRRAGRDWWSLQPPVRAAVPQVRQVDRVRTPIDAFIAAKLEERGLAFAPDADRATLLRRVKFDLLGLPPTPEEIDEFLSDPGEDAYERLVDRLLASPHYGERWARHWLDVVRFGETNGYETNTPRDNAWPYRDYVIGALNEDRPYDRFILEQLAGDQLGIGIGTAMLVGGTHDVVGINNIEGQLQQRADDLDDMANTTGSALLGLTLSCARCHDHKFDPVTQVDYYRIVATLAGVQHADRPVEALDYQRQKHLIEPMRRRLADVIAQLESLDRRIDQLADRLAVVDAETIAAGQFVPRPAVSPLGNVERFPPTPARFVRLTVLATSQYEPCIDELEVFTAEEQPRNVALTSAGAKATASGVYAEGREEIHQLQHVNDGRYGNGRSWISNQFGQGWVQIELAEEALVERVVWARDREGRYQDRLATRYRVEVAVEPSQWSVVATSDDRAAYEAGQPHAIRRADVLPEDEAARYRELVAQRAALEQQLPRPTLTAYAGTFNGSPPPVRRLQRGEVMQPRDAVPPGAIGGVGREVSLPDDAPDARRRMELARWIADENNPLTARVIVNRLWHYHFGTGLVSTPSNFGFLGGKPSHPELLDWLALELVSRGWSLKEVHRLMLLSTVYRQSSRFDAAAHEVDAGMRLLWRYPPRRLEAEPIRDTILAVAGTLDVRMGGPGWNAFEPNSNYVRVYVPKAQFGPAEWRRMIYQTKPRMEQDATFGDFDCPDASSVTPARNTSTTALQALNLLNSHFVMQQAEHFAARLRREAGEDAAAQVGRAFLLAFGRPPDEEESSAAAALVREHGLEAFCRAMLNASELIYVN